MATAPCRHRAFKPPRCRRRRGERGNFKTALRAAGLHTTHGRERGAHGGKSEVSPVLHEHCDSEKSTAHSLWLAQRIAQSRYCGQSRNGQLRTLTDAYGRWDFGVVWVMCYGNATAHGSLGGWRSTLCRADTVGREIGLIGPIGLIRREHLERCMPCAVKISQHMAVRVP